MTTTQVNNAITLSGSSEMVAEFFGKNVFGKLQIRFYFQHLSFANIIVNGGSERKARNI